MAPPGVRQVWEANRRGPARRGHGSGAPPRGLGGRHKKPRAQEERPRPDGFSGEGAYATAGTLLSQPGMPEWAMMVAIVPAPFANAVICGQYTSQSSRCQSVICPIAGLFFPQRVTARHEFARTVAAWPVHLYSMSTKLLTLYRNGARVTFKPKISAGQWPGGKGAGDYRGS